MHPQTKAYLDYTAANNPMLADATLEQRRADVADYLMYAGPVSDDVHTEHSYFTSPTADLHAVIYRPKNVKPNAPELVYFHGGGWVARLLEQVTLNHRVGGSSPSQPTYESKPGIC